MRQWKVIGVEIYKYSGRSSATSEETRREGAAGRTEVTELSRARIRHDAEHFHRAWDANR